MMYAVLSLGLALLGGAMILAGVLVSELKPGGRKKGKDAARGIWPIPLWRTAFSLCWWVLRRCHGW